MEIIGTLQESDKISVFEVGGKIYVLNIVLGTLAYTFEKHQFLYLSVSFV